MGPGQHILTMKSQEIYPVRIKAILEMPLPRNLLELKSLWGSQYLITNNTPTTSGENRHSLITKMVRFDQVSSVSNINPGQRMLIKRKL